MQKLDALRFGLATAIVTLLLWLVCSAVFVASPMGSMMAGGYPAGGGYMMHGGSYGAGWAMGWGGFFAGLVVWPIIAGLAAWAVAAIYNKLLG